MASGIQLRDVRKTFGATEVIKGIDLDIEPGEFVVLVGPSGSGATFNDLAPAIAAAAPGDVILVQPGAYQDFGTKTLIFMVDPSDGLWKIYSESWKLYKEVPNYPKS